MLETVLRLHQFFHKWNFFFAQNLIEIYFRLPKTIISISHSLKSGNKISGVKLLRFPPSSLESALRRRKSSSRLFYEYPFLLTRSPTSSFPFLSHFLMPLRASDLDYVFMLSYTHFVHAVLFPAIALAPLLLLFAPPSSCFVIYCIHVFLKFKTFILFPDPFLFLPNISLFRA